MVGLAGKKVDTFKLDKVDGKNIKVFKRVSKDSKSLFRKKHAEYNQYGNKRLEGRNYWGVMGRRYEFDEDGNAERTAGRRMTKPAAWFQSRPNGNGSEPVRKRARNGMRRRPVS